MKKYINYILLSLLVFTSPLFLEVLVDDSEVYAADPPKKTSSRQAVRKRKPLPPREPESPASLPPSRGQDLAFEDTKGLGAAGKPVDAILILDSSRSMQRNDPARLRDQGSRLFLQFLEPDDRFSLIEFGEQASVLQPLTYLKNSQPDEIRTILEGIQNEGNFTDFLFPLEQALEIFKYEKRPGAEKVIILLSDGHMDPDPRVGTKQKRTKKLVEEVVPELTKQNIKLYSLALSEEADKIALRAMAEETGGLSWYAKEVNEIHRIFSDLFLTIKKPQVLELTKDGFEIDGSTHEATFFVNRDTKNETVVVIDPTGKEFLNKDFPSQWKWFKGELFDIITVPQPLPGTWLVTGGSSGFAKLLSDLKLEYSWPGSTFSVGDSVVLKARLTESGTVLNNPQLKDLVFYNFKIINSSKGTVYLQGKLLEKEEGSFQTTVTFNDEGEYKLFLTVTSPTFTRQTHIPFSVSTGLISLVHVPGNEFTGTEDSYEVVLHPATDAFKNLTVGLINNIKGTEEQYTIPLKDFKVRDRTYLVPLNRFKSGKNIVTAVFSAIGEDRKKIVAKSEVLEISVSQEASSFQETEKENAIDIENIDFSEDAESEAVDDSSPGILWGIVSLVIGLIVSLGGARFHIKSVQRNDEELGSLRESYGAPKELLYQIETLRGTSSAQKRQANEQERELFSSIPAYNEIISQYVDDSSDKREGDLNEKDMNDNDSRSDDLEDAPSDSDIDAGTVEASVENNESSDDEEDGDNKQVPGGETEAEFLEEDS